MRSIFVAASVLGGLQWVSGFSTNNILRLRSNVHTRPYSESPIKHKGTCRITEPESMASNRRSFSDIKMSASVFHTHLENFRKFDGFENIFGPAKNFLKTSVKTAHQAVIPSRITSAEQARNWILMELSPWIVSLLTILIPSLIIQNFDMAFIWLQAEMVFFVASIWRYGEMNRLSHTKTKDSTNFVKLWKDCFSSIRDGRQWLSGWFFNAPINRIRREDVITWLSWAVFGHDDKHLTNQVVTEKYFPSL